MARRWRLAAVFVLFSFVVTLVPMVARQKAFALPNPVATDEPTYQAFGRAFPDPHGCLAYGVPDSDGDGMKDVDEGVSPWAKGRVCANQFLSYEEVIEGAKFLARRFPDFLRVVRLDQAYDNPNYRSAGVPRSISLDGGSPKVMARDRRPLYMFRVTDRTSDIPASQRKHFAFSLSIHGPERAGLEGGVRAMEDVITWAACERADYQANTPACAVEGPFPKKIVEGQSSRPVPTAGQTLRNSILYFTLPNPDGWSRGQTAPVEIEDGSPNPSYLPGFAFQRFNGNGVDLNRDWPTVGYTYRPYSPGSEPETKAYDDVLSGIRARVGKFAGGLDLHGMLMAKAFSFTLIGAGQRDYRKNAITVDTSVRTWEDQTKRLAWSPYVLADENENGYKDTGDRPCLDSNSQTSSTPCVADRWGTVIDTIGYQITGGFGDWFDSPLGLDAVGVDNEMFVSHIVPNSIYEPALTQSHIDGNEGLIFSQIAALLTAGETTFEPGGKVGYVFDPNRLQIAAQARPANPGLPAQSDIEVLLPCRPDGAGNIDGHCGEGQYTVDPDPDRNPATVNIPIASYEFEVKGPDEEIFNGGITATTTHANVNGISPAALPIIYLDYFDEGQWQQAAASVVGEGTNYHQAGRIATVNDPEPGRWRVRFQLPSNEWATRLQIDFQRDTAEASPGQAAIDASSMDFFTELNRYAPDGEKLASIDPKDVAADVNALRQFDSVVLVNDLGSHSYLVNQVGLSEDEATRFFDNLKQFVVTGGNLVLTDKALRALAQMGLIADSAIHDGNFGPAPSFSFNVSGNGLTYREPQVTDFPLAAGVDLPGAAERTLGTRQATEPVPLGYSPNGGAPAMPITVVTRSAWEAACGKSPERLCTTALGSGNFRVNNQPRFMSEVNLGEMNLGEGRIRIAGNMFPNPLYSSSAAHDVRFGLASYALTYTGYLVFENLINWTNPGRIDPSEQIATTLSFTGSSATSGYHSDKAAIELALLTQDGAALMGAPVGLELTSGGNVVESLAGQTDEQGLVRFTLDLDEVPGEYGLVATFGGTDEYLGSVATNSFLVRKELTTVDVNVTGSGSNRVISARLTDDDGTPLAGKGIVFYADGQNIGGPVTTNANGEATLEAPPDYRGGAHKYDAVFEGDSTHETGSGSFTTKG